MNEILHILTGKKKHCAGMGAPRQRFEVHTVSIFSALLLLSLSVVAVSSADATGAALPASSSTAAPARVSGCDPGWAIVSSPEGGTDSNSLNGVAAISSNDIWAVGSYTNLGSSSDQTLTMHWDGSAWSVVPSPSPSTNYNFLSGVAAISSNDVWAVGTFSDPNVDSAAQTLIEHWDGSAWSVVPSADVAQAYNSLGAVAALVPNDIWAVGFYASETDGEQQTLIEHWDGSAWSVVPSPTFAVSYIDLNGVAAISANNVWAVGHINTNENQTLIEHWDGSAWSVVPSPSGGQLNGVTAISSDDIWAVGVSAAQTLTEHWDGSAWSVVPSPNPGSDLRSLDGVTALASNDVWAVGTFFDFDNEVQTLTEHWDGSAWSVVPSPNVGTDQFNYLNSVSAVASDDVWAVGLAEVNYANESLTLTQHYSGSCGTPTPTPVNTATATATPTLAATPTPMDTPTMMIDPTPLSTSTPTVTDTAMPISTATIAATNTPLSTATIAATSTMLPVPATETATPAVCTLSFEDVPPGSTFYSYIQCLVCRGIVSGYSDGTFRPGNNVTRGQAAKIIANSAGFHDPIPADRQTFNDVPPESTFWIYIERAALHGVISGYACGGQGEPCPGAYFRPDSNLTRGQFAKIDSQAFGYTDLIPGDRQTFNDVPPASTFWMYIERLAMHNVIDGYPCGGAGEPCPGAYYRPGNSITRGQMSKVAANTFFPECSSAR